MKETRLIHKLKRKNTKALQLLYNKHACQFKYLIYRYIGDESLAEDILQDGFIRIFEKIHQFKGTGSFEAWCRRIFVNMALEHLRKNKKMVFSEDSHIESIIEQSANNEAFDTEIEWENISEDEINMEVIHAANFSDKDLEDALKLLPEHYKIVFNLYAIDGYKHKEISEMLNINENTSKSRLSKARKITKAYLYKKAITKVRKEQYHAQ